MKREIIRKEQKMKTTFPSAQLPLAAVKWPFDAIPQKHDCAMLFHPAFPFPSDSI
jgi:hypothetical protein